MSDTLPEDPALAAQELGAASQPGAGVANDEDAEVPTDEPVRAGAPDVPDFSADGPVPVVPTDDGPDGLADGPVRAASTVPDVPADRPVPDVPADGPVPAALPDDDPARQPGEVSPP